MYRFIALATFFYIFNSASGAAIPSNFDDKSPIILPGMKWCGRGDTAKNYTDLGEAVEADKCCRTHDHCGMKIKVGATFEGLTNDKIYTIDSCECDTVLRDCLMKANTLASDAVGELFFNILEVKCVRLDYPIKTCNEFGGFLNLSCQNYTLDTSKPKAWGIYDLPAYISKTSKKETS